MTNETMRWMAVFIVCLAACDCGDDGTGPGTVDGSTSRDGSTARDGALPGSDGSMSTMDGSMSTMDGSTSTMDGSTSMMDGSMSTMDGSMSTMDGAVARDGALPPGVCAPAGCQTHVYACGNCLDDDGDGLIDSADPDCLGPCDNNEGGFALLIPGGAPPNCSKDCYYDQDDGSGNDDCQWDHRCDPLEPSLPRCEYSDPPPSSARCPDPQSAMCHDFCGPLTPNGCDCFGCCELPAGSGSYVFIGSVDADRNPTCSLDRVTDPTLCHPCTPVGDCLNTCERCELCLGRGPEDLPPDCFPTVPDAGMLIDAGHLIDAGQIPDGGTPIDAGTYPDAGMYPDAGSLPTCDDGRQLCGLPGLPACPAGYYCITGCCTFFG